MKISLEALKAIEAIHRLGSFSAAADELNKVRSALSYTIKNLEDSLGVEIFDRTGYRAELTDYGKLILGEGRKILYLSTHLEERIKSNTPDVQTKYTVSYDELIPFRNIVPLINQFTTEFPKVNLCIRSERLLGCWDALYNNRTDFVIGLSNRGYQPMEYYTKSLGVLDFVFVVAPNHPLNMVAEPLSDKDVRHYLAITATNTSKNPDDMLSSGTFSDQKELSVDSLQNKLELHLAGLGAGYLPFPWVKPYIESGHLVMKEGPSLKSKVHLTIAWRNQASNTLTDWWIHQSMAFKNEICQDWHASDSGAEV